MVPRPPTWSGRVRCCAVHGFVPRIGERLLLLLHAHPCQCVVSASRRRRETAPPPTWPSGWKVSSLRSEWRHGMGGYTPIVVVVQTTFFQRAEWLTAPLLLGSRCLPLNRPTRSRVRLYCRRGDQRPLNSSRRRRMLLCLMRGSHSLSRDPLGWASFVGAFKETIAGREVLPDSAHKTSHMGALFRHTRLCATKHYTIGA